MGIVAYTPKDLLLRVVKNAYSMAKIFSMFAKKFTNDVDDVSCVVRPIIKKFLGQILPDMLTKDKHYIDIAMYMVCNRVVALVVDYHNIMEYHESIKAETNPAPGKPSYESFRDWESARICPNCDEMITFEEIQRLPEH